MLLVRKFCGGCLCSTGGKQANRCFSLAWWRVTDFKPRLAVQNDMSWTLAAKTESTMLCPTADNHNGANNTEYKTLLRQVCTVISSHYVIQVCFSVCSYRSLLDAFIKDHRPITFVLIPAFTLSVPPNQWLLQHRDTFLTMIMDHPPRQTQKWV